MTPFSQREAVEERADARHGRTLTRRMLALHSVKSLVAEQGRSSVARTPHFTRTIGAALYPRLESRQHQAARVAEDDECEAVTADPTV
jgi:hypothetical protein